LEKEGKSAKVMKEIVLPDSQKRHLNTVMGLYGCDVGIHVEVGGEGRVKVLHVVPEHSLAIGWKRFGVLHWNYCHWLNAPPNLLYLPKNSSASF
jgi:hypothetical protein